MLIFKQNIFVIFIFNKNAFQYDAYRPLFTVGGLCPRGSLSGSLCPGGFCPGALCMWGLCMWGLCPGGGLCPRGLCPETGSLSERKIKKEHGTRDRDPQKENGNQAAKQEVTPYRDPPVKGMTHASENSTLS